MCGVEAHCTLNESSNKPMGNISFYRYKIRLKQTQFQKSSMHSMLSTVIHNARDL